MQRRGGGQQQGNAAVKEKLRRGGGKGLKIAGWPYQHILGAAIAIVAVTITVLTQMHIWWTTPSNYLHVLPIAQININNSDALSVFFEKYHGRLPVVFEGALSNWPAMRWTTDSLAQLCASAELPVYAYDTSSKEWAALRETGNMKLSAYFARFFGRATTFEKASLERPPYGLEMGLRNECPELLEDVRIPAPFSDDLLARYYRKSAWPTLIVGPAGTRSGLHRDTHDFPFWMALFVGRKRWRIFLHEETALRPYYRADRNGFDFDPFQPDFTTFPGLGKASVFEHILKPGELLYIPNGAPHAAQNHEDAIAISSNYLDAHSLSRHFEGTCQQSLWMQSKLCWFYNHNFEKHKAPSWQKMQELNYFQYSGFKGRDDWCTFFLPDLRVRAAKRPELERTIPIVERYCGGDSIK